MFKSSIYKSVTLIKVITIMDDMYHCDSLYLDKRCYFSYYHDLKSITFYHSNEQK